MGREERLNKAIFQILAMKGPLIRYEIYKMLRKERGLSKTRYDVLSRRMKRLERRGYVERAGTKKTQPGPRRPLYRLTNRARLVMLLHHTDLDKFVEEASEPRILAAISALVSE